MEEWLGGRGGAVFGSFRDIQSQYGCESWINTRTGFDSDQVVLFQLFARQWIGTVLRDIFLNETTFVNVSRL